MAKKRKNNKLEIKIEGNSVDGYSYVFNMDSVDKKTETLARQLSWVIGSHVSLYKIVKVAMNILNEEIDKQLKIATK